VRCAIVGGGLLGLTLALRMRAAGDDVTVYESAPEIGGLAAPWELGGVTWDRHYHVTLYSDTATRALLAELGVADELEWSTTRTGFFVGGRLMSLSNAVEFALFPPLGPIDKLRLAATILRASRGDGAGALAHVPVGAWLRRWSGRTTYERIWLPLLRAKLGEAHERVAAAFIRATVARLYAARRAGLDRERFGYVRGGYAVVLRRFADVLAQRGVTVRTATPVRAVLPGGADGAVRVTTADGSAAYDRVVVTAPAPVAARLCSALTAPELERLRGVEYQGIVCASLLLSRPLSPYYVTNVCDPVPFSAVIEMTALVDPAAFGGRHLVYLPRYCPPDDPLQSLDDESVRARFVAGLRTMHPDLRDEEILAFRVSRVPYVFPLPTLGYTERIPAVRTSVAGLYVVNAAQIVDGTLNVNETVGLANDAARTILAEPVARTTPPAAEPHLVGKTA
jgi:protoporphyrinogen oxidase